MGRSNHLLSCAAIGLLACSGGRAPAPPMVPVAPPTPPATATPAPAPAPIPGGAITVTVLPAPVYVERGASAQHVNCDLRIDNGTGVPWQLVELELSAHDRTGALALRKRVNDNGVSPAILTVPNRDLPATGAVLVLNPLHELPLAIEPAKLRFALTFQRPGGDERTTVTAEVAPVVYQDQVALRLPLAGRVLVWDGHDFLSHHRRWDYLFAQIRELGFDSNAGRYSYDLVPVDARGAMHRGDPRDDAGYVGFGQPVLAPGPGTVIAVVDDQPDDHRFDLAAVKRELLVVYGNRVLIDHGHGEISMLAHLRQGSAKVKVGDKVVAGQPIAAIGASGSALFPHLHYQLQNGPTGHAEGLPSYFHDFRRVLGASTAAVELGAIDSGDLVERAPPRR
ncbi:MAG TPA: M23 family metallopeptidase [Kofleriaceae bacterium]|nr:M23 family metallopeptidase [Kofleriaceae bacterium]